MGLINSNVFPQTMVQNRWLQMRMTDVQDDLIRRNSERSGFTNRSAFLRHIGCNQDFETKEQIADIHRILKRLERHLLPASRQ